MLTTKGLFVDALESADRISGCLLLSTASRTVKLLKQFMKM